MAEEFIDDIIAETDAKTADTDTRGEVNTALAPDLATDVEKDNSSPTPDEVNAQKADTSTASDDAFVAPGTSSEVEELATQLGWNKDHKGAEVVDAATYILRSKDIQKTMKDHNKDLKNQLNGLQGSVEALKEHNERVFKADVKKLQAELTVLKAEKKAAIELADVDKVEELDKQIDDVQNDLNAPAKEEVVSDNPVYDEWVADNQWYLTDTEMAQYADAVAEQYPGAPPERVYALVRQKVAEVFPDKFAAETVDPAKLVADESTKVVGPKSPVEANTRTDAGTGFSKADLSAEQLTIMNQFVKGGIMTEEQYVADIAKMQGA